MIRNLFLNGVSVANNSEEFDFVEYHITLGKEDLTLSQEEISYENYLKVMELLKEDVTGSLGKLKKSFNTLNITLQQNKILDILKISLGTTQPILLKCKPSWIRIMINDFFFLNHQLKEELKSLSAGLASAMMIESYVNLEHSLNQYRRDLLKERPKTSSLRSAGRTSQKSRKRKK